MKKSWIVAGVVLLVIASALAFFFLSGKKESKESVSAEKTQQKKETSKTEEVKKGLLDFLSLGGGIKCSVEDETGKFTVVSNGSKVRMEGINFSAEENADQSKKGVMINDGEWAYIWSSKEGMKFNIKEMEELSGGSDENENFKSSDWKSWAKDMEESGAKYDCSPAVVSDSDFTPPADVSFQDMGEFFKQFKEMGQQLQNKLPASGQGQ